MHKGYRVENKIMLVRGAQIIANQRIKCVCVCVCAGDKATTTSFFTYDIGFGMDGWMDVGEGLTACVYVCVSFIQSPPILFYI